MIRVPPLRERQDDVSLLVHHFLVRYAREFGKPVRGITSAAMDILLRYTWPGNVRELENAIERAVALADGTDIGPQDLTSFSTEPGRQLPSAPAPGGTAPWLATVPGYAAARAAFESSYMQALLQASNGNMTEAARISGIARQNLYQKLKKFGKVHMEN
jgi:DNA-binding NtrC family response regulator